MKKNKKLTKKQVNLGGLSEKVYKALCVNPTTKYAIERTGKSKAHVGKILIKLTKEKWISKLQRGHYKVNQNKRVITQVNQNKQEATERLQQDLIPEDYFRLHNLEIAIKLPSNIFKQIKVLAFKRKVFKNLRTSGSNNGYYFNIENSFNDYMLTRENLFLFFSRDWDLKADTIRELNEGLYDAVMHELDILQSRYKFNCFKDGRVNFEIRNMHVALCRNGIAKEFKDQKLDKLVIYDNVDGKPRYIFDFSNLLNELEGVHPEYAIDDADKAKRFMTDLKDGVVNKVLSSGNHFFDDNGGTSLSDLKKMNHELTKNLSGLSKNNLEQSQMINLLLKTIIEMSNTQLNTQKQLEILTRTVSLLHNTTESQDIVQSNELNDKPYYVG